MNLLTFNEFAVALSSHQNDAVYQSATFIKVTCHGGDCVGMCKGKVGFPRGSSEVTGQNGCLRPKPWHLTDRL